MRSVKIKTKELLEVLKENRAQHVLDFDDAYTSYIEQATKELEAAYVEAKNTNVILRNPIRAVEPHSYEESYNTVIRMLEMSDDKIVELTQQEFSQYVEDKWAWKESFTTTSSLYKKT